MALGESTTRTRAKLRSMRRPNGTTPDPWTRRHHDLIPVPAIRTLVTLLVLVLTTACAKPPLGPPFEPAPVPPDHRGRVYIYRSDQPGSLATVRITIDGLEIGRFQNNEYETRELSTGGHQLRAGMRGFGLLAWGWNNHRFRLGPGETVYLKISVRLTEHSAPPARDLEIAGRPTGGASENVYLIRVSAKEALSDLAITTRLSRPETVGD
jgi:hypothetical protein